VAYVVIGCRCVLAVVFAAAVGGKLRGRAAFRLFAGSLADARLVPRRWRYPLAVSVAGAELTTLVLLVVPGWRMPGLVAALAVLTVLAGGIALTLHRGIRASCRCFGGTAERLGPPQLLRNVVLAMVAAAGVVLSTAASARAGQHPAGVVIALAAGAIGGLLAVRVDDLVELFGPRRWTAVVSGSTRPLR